MATTYREGKVIHHEGAAPPPMDTDPAPGMRTTAGQPPVGPAPEPVAPASDAGDVGGPVAPGATSPAAEPAAPVAPARAAAPTKTRKSTGARSAAARKVPAPTARKAARKSSR